MDHGASCLVTHPNREPSQKDHCPPTHLTRHVGAVSPLFLALRLLCGLGNLATRLLGLGDALDDTNSDGLTHVAKDAD